MENSTFDVVKYFNDGTWDYVVRSVGAVEAFNVWRSVMGSPSALMGVVDQVLIIDQEDTCNAHWQFGKGIIFPTPEDIAKMRQGAKV